MVANLNTVVSYHVVKYHGILTLENVGAAVNYNNTPRANKHIFFKFNDLAK